MSFPPFVSSLTLNVSTGASPNVETFEQDILPSELSGTTTNSVIITNSDLLNAFSSRPLGTIFTPSIVTTYEDFPSNNTIPNEAILPFVPRKIITNLSFQHIPDLNALTQPFSLIISTNSPVPLTFLSSDQSVATVSSGGLVTLQGSGTVTITASQEMSSDTVYTAATFVSREITVVKEILTLSNFIIPSKNFGIGPFTLQAPTSNSVGAFTYSVVGNAGVVDISGNQVTILSAGTTTIRATRAVTNKYTSATIDATLVVNPILPTFGIGSFTVPAKNFGNQPFPLQAPTSNSDGAFTYTSSNTAVATISSPIIFSDNFNTYSSNTSDQAQYQSNLMLAVGGTFTGWSTTNSGHVVDQANFLNGTNPKNFSIMIWDIYDVFTQLVAASNSNLLNAVYDVNFNAGPAVYQNPSQATTSSDGLLFQILRPNDTILASFTYLPGAWTGYPTLSAISFSYTGDGSGNVRLRIKSSNESPTGHFAGCVDNIQIIQKTSININIVGAGSSTITATQAATNNYITRSISDTLVVSPIAPTFGSFTVPAKNFGSADFTLTGPSSNNIDGSFSYTSSNPAVATITENTVSIVGAGSSTITATQAATTNYITRSVSATFDVNQAATVLGAFSISDITFGDSNNTFTLQPPTSDSDGAFTYSVVSTTGEVDISGNKVIILSAGTNIIIRATQAATTNYTSATTDATFRVNQAATVLGPFTISDKTFGDSNNTFTLQAPTSNSNVAFTYSVVGTDGVVDISNNVVTILSTGTTTIRATQAATNNYTSATTTASLVVKGWTQRGLAIDGKAGGDFSGHSVSLNASGNTLAIGAIYNGSSGPSAGHVRVYDWNTDITPNGWTKRGLDINGEAAFDYSGHSVSLSSNGNTVAIGAPYNDGTGPNAGHVRVYDWNTYITPNGWTQRGLDINGEAADDQSGHSVSLSSNGNTVAIGAPQNNNTGSDAGHVRVYDWNGSSWTQRGLDGLDINGEAQYDYSGWSVSLSSNGNTVAIGAVGNDDSNSDAGHVRVYDWNGSSWTKRGLNINGEAADDQSGDSVSLSSDGNTVAIGAKNNDGAGENAGHVRVYDWNGSSWTKRGLDIVGEAEYDYSGHSVSLSSNGNTVAIGAPYNDGTGPNAGHVRVYDWNTDITPNGWTKRGLDINGEAAYDQSGRSVSLSSDGNMVAIGAPYNGVDGSNAGHVRVYRYV
jgi:hypothetical protein